MGDKLKTLYINIQIHKYYKRKDTTEIRDCFVKVQQKIFGNDE
jgi:hypothetical protein